MRDEAACVLFLLFKRWCLIRRLAGMGKERALPAPDPRMRFVGVR